MSLEAILATIEASGEAEAARLHAETDARVRQVLADAEQTAAERREAARREALRPAAAECARRLYRAKLEARRTVGQVRDGLVQTALAEAHTLLAGLRAAPDYPLILRRLTDEAWQALGGDRAEASSCRLDIDPRDKALVQCILSDLGLGLEISPSLDCWGGLVAHSSDGRITASNTLEARLERATPFLRRTLASVFDKASPPPKGS
jgi:V/A-type H+-transporting ATPase subunit E